MANTGIRQWTNPQAFFDESGGGGGIKKSQTDFLQDKNYACIKEPLNKKKQKINCPSPYDIILMFAIKGAEKLRIRSCRPLSTWHATIYYFSIERQNLYQ